jgi:hypothetical protein
MIPNATLDQLLATTKQNLLLLADDLANERPMSVALSPKYVGPASWWGTVEKKRDSVKLSLTGAIGNDYCAGPDIPLRVVIHQNRTIEAGIPRFFGLFISYLPLDVFIAQEMRKNSEDAQGYLHAMIKASSTVRECREGPFP